MEFRAIFIANPAQLSFRKEQLVIRQTQEVTVPMEDITSLMLESQAVTISSAALQKLADYGERYISVMKSICPRPCCCQSTGTAAS